MRRVFAVVVACCVLAACGRTANNATDRSGAQASPSAIASNAAASGKEASSLDAATSSDTRDPSTGRDAVASPASLAGTAHVAGSGAALRKDAFVLPGAIDADTELVDLRRIYGATNVREGDLPGGGDETVHGVILFPGDPRRRAYVYFQDAKTLTGLSMVGVLDQDSLWRSAQGVRVGMPLAELVVLNGKPFEFFGFEGVYGGWISDWLDGRLAQVGSGMSLHVRLSHRVFPKDVPYGDLPYENFRSFHSDQPQLAKMKVVVDEITLNMPGEDDR